jgi:hypothetical protein
MANTLMLLFDRQYGKTVELFYTSNIGHNVFKDKAYKSDTIFHPTVHRK